MNNVIRIHTIKMSYTNCIENEYYMIKMTTIKITHHSLFPYWRFDGEQHAVSKIIHSPFDITQIQTKIKNIKKM